MKQMNFVYNASLTGRTDPEMSPLVNFLVHSINSNMAEKDVIPRVEHTDSMLLTKVRPLDLTEKLRTEFCDKVYCHKNNLVTYYGKTVIYIQLRARLEHTSLNYIIYGFKPELVRKTEKALRNCLSSLVSGTYSNYCEVKWWYADNEGNEYNYITEVFDDRIYQEAYPYINDLEGLLEEYLDSEESILLFIGPPGTGKTRLIRYIIQKMLKRHEEDYERFNPYSEDGLERDSVWMSYTTDKRVIESDEIFMDLFNRQSIGLVLEDIDYQIKPRKDGDSQVVYKLLGASSGLIKNINKKILLSTNLDDVKDIDAALLRPGRCFAAVKTRLLTCDEAEYLAMKLDPEMKVSLGGFVTGREYSLAQIYKYVTMGKMSNNSEMRRVGF